jgi:hypothetical protein
MPAIKFPESSDTWDLSIQTSLMTAESTNELIERVADGESFKDACKAIGVSRTTVYRWMDRNADFAAAYKWALVCNGLAQGDNIAHLANEAMKDLRVNGELNTDAAAIILKASTWVAERLAPKVYNLKSIMEVTGDNGSPLKIEFSQADQDLC